MKNTKAVEEELLRVQKDIHFYLGRITRLHASLKHEEEKLHFRLQREKALKISLDKYGRHEQEE
ncbi:MAG: hypothetical protein K0R24_62 [Gammaproteobacteria bacterium]|jgi:hypothetical protein|nr:hypothetical protein [Gammaproteobacteria bacterium]MCE3237081.1 hypothetical protein [Gammaproteobacteria bacterium]